MCSAKSEAFYHGKFVYAVVDAIIETVPKSRELEERMKQYPAPTYEQCKERFLRASPKYRVKMGYPAEAETPQLSHSYCESRDCVAQCDLSVDERDQTTMGRSPEEPHKAGVRLSSKKHAKRVGIEERLLVENDFLSKNMNKHKLFTTDDYGYVAPSSAETAIYKMNSKRYRRSKEARWKGIVGQAAISPDTTGMISKTEELYTFQAEPEHVSWDMTGPSNEVARQQTRKKVGDVMEKEIATATAKGKTVNFNITRMELMDMNIPAEVKAEIVTKYGDKLKGETIVTTPTVTTPTVTTPTTQEIPTMTIGVDTTNVAKGLESDLVKSKLFTEAPKEQQTAIRKMIEMGDTGNANVKLEIETDYAKDWGSVSPTLQKMTTMVVDTKLTNNVKTAVNTADYNKAIDNIALISKDSSALTEVGKALTYAPASIVEKLKLSGISDDVVTAIANARKQNAITELNKKGLGDAFKKFSNGESVTTEELNNLFNNRELVQGGMFKSIAENATTNKKIFDAKAEQLMFNGTAEEKTAFRIEIEKEIQSCRKLGTCI